jgi:hypothetical protein
MRLCLRVRLLVCLTPRPSQSFVPSVGEGCLSRSSTRFNVDCHTSFVWFKSYSMSGFVTFYWSLAEPDHLCQSHRFGQVRVCPRLLDNTSQIEQPTVPAILRYFPPNHIILLSKALWLRDGIIGQGVSFSVRLLILEVHSPKIHHELSRVKVLVHGEHNPLLSTVASVT